jgi:hypothetical protein
VSMGAFTKPRAKSVHRSPLVSPIVGSSEWLGPNTRSRGAPCGTKDAPEGDAKRLLPGR